MAGMLAVFHDVLTAVTAGAAVVAAIQAGDLSAAFTMSAATLALLGNLETSVVAEDQLIVADLKILGIINLEPLRNTD